MLRQPGGCSLLIGPRESVFCVLRELHVVRGIGIDEIVAFEWDRFEISAGEGPVRKQFAILPEIRHIPDPRVAAEGHVEFARTIEPAQPVEARPVQVIEDGGGFPTCAPIARKQGIETIPVCVKQVLVVLHRKLDAKSLLKPPVEVDQVGIRIVQQRPRRQEPQCHRQAPAERLDQPPLRMSLPDRSKVGHLPPLAAGPLQRRSQRRRPRGYAG